MNFLDELSRCFGKSLDAPELTALLNTQAPYRADKPSDGSQYVVSKPGGFDLLFKDEQPVAGKRAHRVLVSIFLYAEGADQHRAYAGELPYGFSITDTRAALIAKRMPERTWVIGEGRVSVDHPAPDSDRWSGEVYDLSTQYWDDGRVHHFQLTPHVVADPSREWKAPPTWKALALDPARKFEALQLYRAEHGGSVSAAKAAIDAFAAGQAG